MLPMSKASLPRIRYEAPAQIEDLAAMQQPFQNRHHQS
jgi:hypothetical protein